MKHLLLSASLLLCSSPLLHAQDDPKSRAIIDKMIAKNKTWTSFEADFTSRMQDKAAKLDVSQSGTVKVKGKKFTLVLDKNIVINDGTTLYTYSKESNEVSLSDPSDMAQDLDPSNLMSAYEKGYKSQFVEEKTDASGVVVQVIKLFPIEPGKKPFHTVVITLDKAKLEPRVVEVLYKDGNVVTYTLKRLVPNVELADALFQFDKSKYPGVEINDLR